MPKTRNTRKDKADQLLRVISEGPSLGFNVLGGIPEKFGYIPSELRKIITKDMEYQVTESWLKTWVIPLVKELVPEFAKMSDAEFNDRVNLLKVTRSDKQ